MEKGYAIGSTIGRITGIIVEIGTSVIILRLVIVIAAPIATGLVSACARGVTGRIIGVLVGSGIPEVHAKLYDSGIKEGQIVISVKPSNDDDAKYSENNWRENNAEEIQI